MMPSPMDVVLRPHGFLYRALWANSITVVVLNLVSGARPLMGPVGLHWGQADRSLRFGRIQGQTGGP
jgi:hypothetical protein